MTLPTLKATKDRLTKAIYFGHLDNGGATGTVTSVDMTVPAEFAVAGNPITTAGTLAITKATQSANRVYAGPTSGGAAAPTFRALVANDIPAMVGDTGAGGVQGAVPAPAIGDAGNYLRGDGTWVAVGGGGGGTVTSVGLALPAEFTISSSPVVASGTLTGARNRYGTYLSIVDYGADPTGVADSTAAINAALAALPAQGGGIYCPAGDYLITDTIVIGDGTPLGSTVNGIEFFGAGTGPQDISFNEITRPMGATRFIWDGADAGTMFRIQGPIGGIHLHGFTLQASRYVGGYQATGLSATIVTHAAVAGAIDSQTDASVAHDDVLYLDGYAYIVDSVPTGASITLTTVPPVAPATWGTWTKGPTATVGIECRRMFDSIVENIVLGAWGDGPALWVNAAGTPINDGGGAPNRWVFRDVYALSPARSTSTGLMIGYPGNVSGIDGFYNCWFARGDASTAKSLHLGYCDHISFYNCQFTRHDSATGPGHGVYVDPEVTFETFPLNINFYACTAMGGVGSTGTWTPSNFSSPSNAGGWPALTFFPYITADSEPTPPNGSNGSLLRPELVGGITDSGCLITTPKRGYGTALISSSTPIANYGSAGVTPVQFLSSSAGNPAVELLTAPYVFNRPGEIINVRMAGTYTYTGNPAVYVSLWMDAVRVASFVASLPASGGSSTLQWSAEAQLVVRTTGATASVQPGFGMGVFRADGVGVAPISSMNLTYAPVTLDLTNWTTLKVKGDWSVADPSNSLTLTQFTVTADGFAAARL